MTDLSMQDVDNLLKQWAAWSRVGVGVRLGLSVPSEYEAVTIGDSCALIVDGIVGGLQLAEPGVGRVLVAYYRRRKSIVEIAEDERINRKTASGMLVSARAYVAGAMNNLAKAA